MFSRTLSDHAQNTLALLSRKKVLPPGSYLAGGSSLALQLGHRRSIDFDFFTNIEFETKEIKTGLRSIGVYIEETETPRTMVGKFNNVKFSLFYYPYDLIRKTTKFLGIELCSKEDIGAMKLVAVTDRGTKKDFIDLYFLAKECFPIEKMFDFYEEKYHNLTSNQLTLLKALQYLDDAEDSEMPEMIRKIDWQEVKKFFREETVRLAEKYI